MANGIGCELDDAAPADGIESSRCGRGDGQCGVGVDTGDVSMLELLSLPYQTCGPGAAATCSGIMIAGAAAAGSSAGSSRSAAKNATSGMFVLCGKHIPLLEMLAAQLQARARCSTLKPRARFL